MPRRVLIAAFSMAVGLVCAAAFRHGEEPLPGVATVTAAEIESDVVRGEPYRKTQGDLTAYVPPDVALTAGGFDLLVHFHGASKNQERNVEEAGLRAVVVSANEGMGSTPYARAFAPAGSLDRVIAFAERAAGASGRFDGEPRVRRVALSSWSAGGASVRAILERDASRVDAVLLADGIFSRYEDRKTKTIEARPLEPLAEFAGRAVSGEALMVITHTAIETPGYPNVKECTDALLEAVRLPRSDADVYELDRGELHVRGSAGKGPADHVGEIKALDQAYARLARRWRH
jgi:hypothetical protein